MVSGIFLSKIKTVSDNKSSKRLLTCFWLYLWHDPERVEILGNCLIALELKAMKLLVVEDNRDIAENIADYLEPKGHQMDFAGDGVLGLTLALAEDFDAIVLDLNLPRMDGIELCRQLRSANKATPIIMLTARDKLDDKLEGFGVGADDYLVKPFSVKELEVRLQALLKRLHHFGEVGELVVADLHLDPNTFKVHRGGKHLELNPIQRKLLTYLMQHSPNVVKRAELENVIWGDEPPDKDILRTHIYGLRNLIDKPFKEKLLHTVHSVGYCLAEK